MQLGTGTIYWNLTPINTTDLAVTHVVDGATTAPFLTVTNTPAALEGMSLDLGPFVPFLNGGGTFTATAPSRSVGTDCVLLLRDGTFTGGWTAHLDGWGDIHSSANSSAAGASRRAPAP